VLEPRPPITPERCCFGACFAQKWWRTCFGDKWGVCSVWIIVQQLCAAASCSMVANAVSQRAACVLLPRPLNHRVSDAVPTHVVRRNGGASVSGADRVQDTSETLSSSFAVRHHDQMQANAVSQRAAWVLLPRPLNHRMSDTVSTHVAPRNGGASVSGAVGVLAAHGALRRSFALRHHAWLQANAVLTERGQRAGSSGYSWEFWSANTCNLRRRGCHGTTANAASFAPHIAAISELLLWHTIHSRTCKAQMCLLYGWDRGDKGHQRCCFTWALGRLNSLPIYWHCCIFLRRSSLPLTKIIYRCVFQTQHNRYS